MFDHPQYLGVVMEGFWDSAESTESTIQNEALSPTTPMCHLRMTNLGCNKHDYHTE